MQISVRVWNVALVCLLAVCSVSQVSGLPTDMQSDDWSASTLFTSAVNDYVKPYTGPLVEMVTNSTAWDLFGKATNRVQNTVNVAGGYVHTYYEDHVKDPVEHTKEWIKCKTKPLMERLGEIFQRQEHEEQAQAK